jgi:hypothetical protein
MSCNRAVLDSEMAKATADRKLATVSIDGAPGAERLDRRGSTTRAEETFATSSEAAPFDAHMLKIARSVNALYEARVETFAGTRR